MHLHNDEIRSNTGEEMSRIKFKDGPDLFLTTQNVTFSIIALNFASLKLLALARVSS